jgi:hypothetical protein
MSENIQQHNVRDFSPFSFSEFIISDTEDFSITLVTSVGSIIALNPFVDANISNWTKANEIIHGDDSARQNPQS